MVVAAPYCGRVVFSGGLCYYYMSEKWKPDGCDVSRSHPSCLTRTLRVDGKQILSWQRRLIFPSLATLSPPSFCLHEAAKMPFAPVVVCYSALLPCRDSMYRATVHLVGSGAGATTPWPCRYSRPDPSSCQSAAQLNLVR